MKNILPKIFGTLFVLVIAFATQMQAQEVITFEAEDFDVFDPTDTDTTWVVFDDENASGGKYVKDMFGGKSKKYRGYSFTTTETTNTTFYVWFKTRPRGNWDEWGGKSFLNVDDPEFGDEKQTFCQFGNEINTADSSTWKWWMITAGSDGSPITLNIEAGEHVFYLGSRDNDVQIDQIMLTNDADWRAEITYSFEAEFGELTDPLTLEYYEGASLDTVVSAPAGSGTIQSTDILTGNNDVTITVERAPGNYYVWLLVDLPSEESNSFYVGTGDEQILPPSWEGEVTNGLEWRLVTSGAEGKQFNFELGNWHNGQVLRVKQQEEGTILDKILVTNDVNYIPEGPTGIVEEFTTLPTQFVVEQNYPNPFNPETKIRYQLPEAGNVEVAVYNLIGQRVETLFSGYQSVGTKEITWNAQNYSSGLYFFNVRYGNQIVTKKMMLMK